MTAASALTELSIVGPNRECSKRTRERSALETKRKWHCRRAQAPFEADAGLGEQRASLSHDKLPLQLSHDQVASYEETFSKIREATGVDSIPRLIENFQEIEQKNFSLFNSPRDPASVSNASIWSRPSFVILRKSVVS